MANQILETCLYIFERCNNIRHATLNQVFYLYISRCVFVHHDFDFLRIVVCEVRRTLDASVSHNYVTEQLSKGVIQRFVFELDGVCTKRLEKI